MPQAGNMTLKAYPNPASRLSYVGFQLSESGHVKLDVFDMSGRKIATLVNGHRAKDNHIVTWNTSGVPNGMYFCRLTAGNQSSTVKLIINH